MGPSLTPDAAASGMVTIGGELEVHRMGFGAMRLVGESAWGPPKDRKQAHRVLRRAVELGINFIDTADSYGPAVDEELIAEALHPYPEGLVIATKAGLVRPAPGEWVRDGRPQHLRRACEASLLRLHLECIDLYQLHRIDPEVPFEDQVGALLELREEGKIRHVGLSEVGIKELRWARQILPVATVQNRYNLADRRWEGVLDYCTKAGVGFIPWIPLSIGALARCDSLRQVAQKYGATSAQVALAWLLQRSPMMIVIPGTSNLNHLDENVGASTLELSDEDTRVLEGAIAAR